MTSVDEKEECYGDYMENSLGHLIPKSTVSDIDKLRDQTVRKIIDDVFKMSLSLKCFKKHIREEIETFTDISASKYGKTWSGKKGNFTLTSFDGMYRIVVAIDENIFFDERLQVARDIIGECIMKWGQGSRDEIMVLVNDAFQVDKAGKINTNRVLGLRRLDIDDPDWKKAMQAITDSVQVTGSKQYIRFYEKNGETGKYIQIPLDVSSI